MGAYPIDKGGDPSSGTRYRAAAKRPRIYPRAVKRGSYALRLGFTPQQLQDEYTLQLDDFDGDEHEFKFKAPEPQVLRKSDIQNLFDSIEKKKKLRERKKMRGVAITASDMDDKTSPQIARVRELLEKYAPVPIHESSSIDRRGTGGGAGWSAIRQDADTPGVQIDIDARCRTVMEELDMAFECVAPRMKSAVLHSTEQMFPVDVLQEQLERELDRLLVLQVLERERATSIIDSAAMLLGDSESDSSDEDDTEEARSMRRKRRAAKAMMMERKGKGIKIAGKGYAANLAGNSRKEQEKAQNEAEVAKERKLIVRNSAGNATEACLACKTAPCSWAPHGNIEALKERQKTLDVERERLRTIDPSIHMVESQVVGSVLRGANPRMTREDLNQELVDELRRVFTEIKLHDTDEELHRAYSVREPYVETFVLHGFRQMQWTKNVIVALERERDKLIATVVCDDIVSDILEWMLEGWYFGERESKHPVMGYVPSIKKDGVIRVHEADDLVKNNKLLDRGEDSEARGLPEDRMSLLAKTAKSKNEAEKAIRAGSDQEHLLNETETNLKFGIFSLTLQYFRAMTLVRRQYETWSGRQAALALEGKHAPREVTAERELMEKETMKLDERLRRSENAEKKAKIGMERRRQRIAKERALQRDHMITVVRKRQLEERSATKIEALYRGHLGRLAAMKWAVKKAEVDAMRALQHAAAVAIQRVWRGIDGRTEAEEKRIEMAEFIAQMRAAEAAEEEEEYWRTHAWARFKRDMRNWWRRRRTAEPQQTAVDRIAAETVDNEEELERFKEDERQAEADWKEYEDNDETWVKGGTNL